MALNKFKAKFGIQVSDSTNSSAPSSTLNGYDLLPIGSIMYWAGLHTNVPNGWLACNGSAISRIDYPNLNALMSSSGYAYGSGDGSTTFNLPNAQGRVLGYHNFPTVNSGSSTYTLSDSNITSHSHGFDHSHPLSSHTHTAAAHTHTASVHTHNVSFHTGHILLAASHTHTGFYTFQATANPGTIFQIPGPTPNPFNYMGAGGGPHGHATGPQTVSTTTPSQSGPTQSDPPASSTSSNVNTADSSPLSTGFSDSPTRASFSINQPWLAVLAIIKVV